MKLMGGAAADGTGVCHHGAEIQTQTPEDTAVGPVHEVIGFL